MPTMCQSSPTASGGQARAKFSCAHGRIRVYTRWSNRNVLGKVRPTLHRPVGGELMRALHVVCSFVLSLLVEGTAIAPIGEPTLQPDRRRWLGSNSPHNPTMALT